MQATVVDGIPRIPAAIDDSETPPAGVAFDVSEDGLQKEINAFRESCWHSSFTDAHQDALVSVLGTNVGSQTTLYDAAELLDGNGLQPWVVHRRFGATGLPDLHSYATDPRSADYCLLVTAHHAYLTQWKRVSRSVPLNEDHLVIVFQRDGSEASGDALFSECRAHLSEDSSFKDAITSTVNCIMEHWDCLTSNAAFGKPVDLVRCPNHEKDGHTKYDPSCLECVRAGLRSRQHRKVSKPGMVRIGRLDLDIACYSGEGPYVLVGVTSNLSGKPVIVAEPLSTRSATDLRRAIGLLVLQCEHTWNTPLVRRVHSDRERGISAVTPELHELGIWSTVTQGYDPAANGRAEGAIGLLSNGARARLSELCGPGVDLTPFSTAVMWTHAMVHASMSYSALHCTEGARIASADILPFGSLVLAREPPARKVPKGEPRAVDGLYLHPSIRTPGAHLVADLERLPFGEQFDYIIRDSRIAVTLRVVQKDGRPVYPAFRVAPMKRKVLRVMQEPGAFEVSGGDPEPSRKRGRPPGLTSPSESSGKRHAAENQVDPANPDQPSRKRGRPADPEPQGLRRSLRIRARTTATYAAPQPAVARLARELGDDILSDDKALHEVHQDHDDLIASAQAYVTRLCTPEETTLPGAVAAEKKEVDGVLSQEVIRKEPDELADIPDGSEVAVLRSILSLKDIETDAPSFKGRVIYRGDIVKEKHTDSKGRPYLTRLKETDDVWSANTVDQASVRLLLSFALAQGYETWSCDIATAYLQATAGGRPAYVMLHPQLERAFPEEIRNRRANMREPVHRLERALYGRRRSGFDWAERVIGVLESMGFRKTASSNGLYYMQSAEVLIAIYVDDLCLAAPKSVADELFERIQKDVRIKEGDGGVKWSHTRRFLGTEYEFQESDTHRFFFIDMESYSLKLIRDFEEKHGATRPVLRLPEVGPASSTKSDMGFKYRPIIGGLLWLGRALRADMVRCINALASCVTAWRPEHDEALRHLMGYLKATSDVRMVLMHDKSHKASDLRVVGWSDASLGVPRSVSGTFMAIVDDTMSTFVPISWMAKRQTVAATSSAAAEYVALSKLVEAAVPLHTTAKEIGLIPTDAPPVECRVDNSAVLLGIHRGWAPYDTLFATRERGVQLRICQLSDLSKNGSVKFAFERGTDMRADGLTKFLTSAESVAHARRQLRLYRKHELQELLPGSTALLTPAKNRIPTSISPEMPEWEPLVTSPDGSASAYILRSAFSAKDLASWMEFCERYDRYHVVSGTDGKTLRRTAWFTQAPCACPYTYGTGSREITMQPSRMRGPLLRLRDRVTELCGLDEPPNSCNLKHYANGEQVVGWHADDESIFQDPSGNCLIISVSLGCPRHFHIRRKDGLHGVTPCETVLLRPGDVLVMQDGFQRMFQHAILRETDCSARANITFRYIARHVWGCPVARRMRKSRAQVHNPSAPLPGQHV